MPDLRFNLEYNRRELLEILGGESVLIGLNAKYEEQRIFVMHQFLLENGLQLERLHTYLRGALLPALAREAGGAQIVLEAIVAAHQPQVLFLQEFSSVAAWREVMHRLKADTALAEANAVWDQPGPYMAHTISLLAATNYCPALQPSAAEAPAGRIFELRVYQAPSEWQLNGVHERFAGPEIPIFHRCGIEPILYASAISGPNLPNLSYLTPFASLAAREKAWATFQADPEWHAVRQASIDQHGYTPRVITTSLFKALGYSPLR
jgi:hypothetical protein